MPQKRSSLLLVLILGGGAFLFFVLCLLALASYFSDEGAPGLSLSTNQIALLDVEGIISDSKEFVDQLKDYGNRAGVRAVIVRINSPGGGVAASQEIYQAIKKFRAETTGSIGVIAEWYNYGDLLRWAKMQDVVIKSGVFKDAGSATRPLTDEERAYFQSLINDMYGQFVSAVASNRKMKEEDVRKLADGRVYTGQQAKQDGLVDEIGTYQDAVAATAKMAGIAGSPRILSPSKKSVSLLDLILGDSRSVLPRSPDRSESHIRFEYLWR
jgi:protease-4